MYDLGEQFKNNVLDIKANPDCIYQGEKYRITILTERLVRLEYNEQGIFEDRPTEVVLNRNFESPKFSVKEDKKYIEIKTANFTLSYTKNKPFKGSMISPSSNLKIEPFNSDKVWYYNHPEVRNYKAPNALLSNKKDYVKSLYSIDGFVSIDDSDSKVFLETGELLDRENKEIDIYIFVYLKDFLSCLKDYYKLTGSPTLIPRFALGNWWSKNECYNDVDLKDLITNFSNNDIPISVLLLDKYWHKTIQDKKKIINSGFTFNDELFKNPSQMINYLHTKGIRTGLSIDPSEGIYEIDDMYEKIKQYIEPNEIGVIPFNIYSSKFIDAYLKLIIHTLDNLGTDFYFLDFYDEKRIDELYRLKHYQIYDMNRNYQRRPMCLSYNTNKVSHRYSCLYSGKNIVSWDTLKKIPSFNSNAFNNGISWWCHDIGGYYKGIEDSELYIRFVQLGVFSPIMKFGADTGKYYKREPWKWDIKTSSITKDYLRFRHKLIPYLYSEGYKYTEDSVPLIQPLYYKSPELYDDPICTDEYYFGGELFVSPIVKKKDPVMGRVIHKFFIPEGIWYDITTGKKFPGGKKYVSFFRDQDYPVFARSGAIIPLTDIDNINKINDTNPPSNLEVQIYPGRSNSYKLYEDDGVSSLYKKGFYLLTDIQYNYLPNNYTVIFRAIDGKSGIVPDKRNYKIRFKNTKKANDVIVYFDNTIVPHEAYVDGNDFIVEVKNVKTIGQLTINCKGKDIEIDAVRVINEDIEKILSDLQIETSMKEKIDKVLFSELTIKKKRIEIRKLKKQGLEEKYIKLFLKLLEYVEQV